MDFETHQLKSSTVEIEIEKLKKNIVKYLFFSKIFYIFAIEEFSIDTNQYVTFKEGGNLFV